LPEPAVAARDRAVAGGRSGHRCEHGKLGVGGAGNRPGHFRSQPARDRPVIAAVLGQRQRHELFDQRPRSRRVEGGHRGRARQDRERALELGLRLEAAPAVERAETRRLPRGQREG